MEAHELDALLDRHRDRLREVFREILEEEHGDDPFRIPLDDFLARPDEERAALVRRAARLARTRVERELEARGASWIVLVGDRVALTSVECPGVPTVDQVLDLGRGPNLVPYLFEAPLIEELAACSLWAQVGTGIPNDRYPTLPVRLGDRVLVADLDTGAHGTLADAVLRDTTGEPDVWFAGRHLGRDFEWSPGLARFEVALADGSVRSTELAMRWVRDWARSPFTRLNARRTVLVGRDALRALGLELVLRAASAETEIIDGLGEG
jgi:hypothetical protein